MTLSEVVILCGGRGTRLRSVVKDVPKPMASVSGRPFLDLLLNQFSNLGFSRAVLSTGYMASIIRNHFGDRFCAMELLYVEDPEPLGTGGAARAGAQACSGESILVCNGDTFIEFDLPAARSLCANKCSPVVVTLRVPDTERYGRIEVDGSSQARFCGRGVAGEGLISGGVYLLARSLLVEDSRPTPFSMEDFVFDIARPGAAYAVEARGRFIDIGVPRDYEIAQAMFGRTP